jgi:predicted MFS family arabinose efflux permease
VLTALGVGLASLASFVAIEARLHERAMMPLSLYRSRNFSATNALTLLLYFALGGALYYLPFGLIRLGGYSATQAGAALLPFALMTGFGASFTGTIADRLGPRPLLAVGPLVAAFGFAVLAYVDFRQAYWAGVFLPMLLLGVGMALTVPPLTSTVMAAAGKTHAGIASGVNNAVARVAGLLAVAVLGAVFFAAFSNDLAGSSSAQAGDALSAVMSGRFGASAEAMVAFQRALRTAMLVPAACAALAGVAGFVWIEPHSAREAS